MKNYLVYEGTNWAEALEWFAAKWWTQKRRDERNACAAHNLPMDHLFLPISYLGSNQCLELCGAQIPPRTCAYYNEIEQQFYFKTLKR